MSHDVVADALSKIMNAKRSHKTVVTVKHHSKVLLAVLAMAKLKGYEIMILELIVLFIIMLAMMSIIVVSWQKQKRKHHIRHMAWMKQQLKNRK